MAHGREPPGGLRRRAAAARTARYDGKRVIQLRFRAAEPPSGFGTVMQSIDAERYRGRRVRFSAVIRGREVADWAGAWLRVDTASGARSLDNMQDRPLRGTTAWTEAANVLDVGEDAASVHFGVLLAGAGAVDLAGAALRGRRPRRARHPGRAPAAGS